MKVLKFGGSSVGTPGRIMEVKKIIESQTSRCVIVVSAFQGVTDQLNHISELASQRNDVYKNTLNNLINKHLEYTRDLITDPEILKSVLKTIAGLFDELIETLNGVYLLREISRHASDKILGFGERLSSFIISRLFDDSTLIDSREFIKTDDKFGNANVDHILTESLINKYLGSIDNMAIVPGFIASSVNGETTTLGRGGSDYTAALIAAALNAECLEIWTDVDGFMSADPRKVDKAYAIETLTYSEAIELSHFGAKVIYTPTLRPVYKKNIPVVVLNSFNPESKGTLISNSSSGESRSPIKGISSIDHIDLITLQGTAMVGVTGTSMRLFGALARNEINIVLITQASSEYSITFAVHPSASGLAVKSLTEEFRREIELNNELKIQVEKNLSIIAIVGEKMKNTPGISATLFRSLARNGINVIATAQGSSELNISVVIKNESLKKALNVIHDGFFLSQYKEMFLFVAGTGIVGSSLLKQIEKQKGTLLKEHSLKVHLMGVANSRKMITDTKGIELENYREILKTSGEKGNIEEFIRRMIMMNLRNSIFIDCTADEHVAMKYEQILSGYVSVVTANKIACSSDYNYYQKLKSIANERSVRFMYETTVGAGLPIIKTINDLVLSGDKIHKIEAVLSGTLNFIFNEIGPDVSLSTAIRRAKEKGFSEPDPRIDLSGTDVVRKILILSREAGFPIQKDEVTVTSFLPEKCFKGNIEDFFEEVKKYDDEFESKRKQLEKEKKKWRFLATLDNGKAKVELITIDQSHPSYDLAGSNNIVLLTTDRYRELPMVIKGYGAGAEVTAAGVFADLMRVVNV
jgi:aspartokinase/homoserine dehydrogenase 1